MWFQATQLGIGYGSEWDAVVSVPASQEILRCSAVCSIWRDHFSNDTTKAHVSIEGQIFLAPTVIILSPVTLIAIYLNTIDSDCVPEKFAVKSVTVGRTREQDLSPRACNDPGWFILGHRPRLHVSTAALNSRATDYPESFRALRRGSFFRHAVQGHITLRLRALSRQKIAQAARSIAQLKYPSVRRTIFL